MNDIPLEHFKKAFEAMDPWIARHVTDSNTPLLMLAAQTSDGSALNRVYSGDGACFTPPQNEAPFDSHDDSASSFTWLLSGSRCGL